MAKWFGLMNKVEILGARSAWDAQQALASVTRGLTSFGARPRKPFIGWIRGSEGRMWFGRSYMSGVPFRSLRFRIEPAEGNGCRLTGQMSFVLPVKLFLAAWFSFCIYFTGSFVHRAMLHGTFSMHMLLSQTPLLPLLLMGCFYCALPMWHGRRAEALGIKAIKHLLADEKSAAVVIDLFSLEK